MKQNIQKQLKKKQQSNKEQKLPSKLILDSKDAPEQPMFPMFSSTSHPILSALHVILKILILSIYIILPIFSKKQLSTLQLVIILSAVDFWVVKNVSGRLLVGLRWWVDFDEHGQQKWKFQCKVNEKDINPANQKIFWWTLILFSIAWIVLTIINIFKLDITNITICVFCAAMLIFNLYSYYKCSKAQSQNLKKLAHQYGKDIAGKFMYGTIVANYF